MVWMPREGTIQRPSSERRVIFPRSPRRRERGESATVTPRLINACLDALKTYQIFGTVAPSSTGSATSNPRCSVNVFTATLDQNEEHDHKQCRSDDPNYRYVIHIETPLLCLIEQIVLEILRSRNERRAQSDHENRGKNEEHEREDELDGRLGRLLFGLLAPLHAQRVRIDA